MSIVSALSKLLVKMGGTPASGDTSDELVSKIADAYSGRAGDGVLIVYVERTATEDSETFTLDKTWQELADALNSGKSLSFVEWDSNENVGNSFTWSIGYLFVQLKGSRLLPLETDSPDGYPTVTIPFET